jgi:hypothetical protein
MNSIEVPKVLNTMVELSAWAITIGISPPDKNLAFSPEFAIR